MTPILRKSSSRFAPCLTVMAVAAVCLALAGCKGPESKVAGRWKDANNDVTVFKDDHTFHQPEAKHPHAGKWSFADKKVTMKIETIEGQPADQVIESLFSQLTARSGKPIAPSAETKKQMTTFTLELSDDGSKLVQVGSNAKKPLQFTKEDSK